MTTNPDEPQVPGGEPTGATPPPPPPAPSGPEAQTPPVAPPVPPAGGYGGPPPAGGYSGPPPAAPAYGAGAAGAPLSDSDQRLWATLAHIGGLILSFVAPLVIWLIYKDRGRFVEEQAKEALNFQITLVIASVVFWIITIVTFGIGGLLFLAFIVALVFMIMAAIATNKGEAYRYPVNIRLIK